MATIEDSDGGGGPGQQDQGSPSRRWRKSLDEGGMWVVREAVQDAWWCGAIKKLIYCDF